MATKTRKKKHRITEAQNSRKQEKKISGKIGTHRIDELPLANCSPKALITLDVVLTEVRIGFADLDLQFAQIELKTHFFMIFDVL